MKVLRTLRGRLVLVLVGALVTGLLLMGMISIALLQRSLVERTDDRLAEMSAPWEHGLRSPPRQPPVAPPRGELPTEFRVLLFDPHGDQVGGMIGRPADDSGGPVLANPLHGREFSTVPDQAGGASWRVRRVLLPDGNVAVLSFSLSTVGATVQELIAIEIAVGAVVLVVLAVAAAIVVRLNLRPLSRIESTADAIAAGQLDRRVPQDDPHTETGRLGTALNTMLGRLVDALQQREHSEQRLRRFIADASHELRTPLTSIRGFAELYRRSDEHREADVRQMMGRIESEAVRMGGLVEDMLLLARLDRERTVDLVDLDLVPLVREVVQDAMARDPERRISLQTPENLRVLGDGPRLRQVLTNLVNNALVHTPADAAIAVDITTAVATDDAVAAGGASIPAGAPVVQVSVADQGPGIPLEHAPRIFDRLYRADESRTAGGSGLGLAISAAIAEAHNGRVELHPTPTATGSLFRLILPQT